MSFYVDLQAKIEALLEKFGETQVLSRKSQVPDDPNLPWRGSVTEETLQVVAVSPELISGDTETLKQRGSKVYVSGSYVGVEEYTFITLLGDRYRITGCNRIGTPSTTVAYELTVKA